MGFKIAFIVTALALFAGACLLFCGFSARLPRGVRINGCDVGGLTYARAERLLREKVEERLKEKKLTIYGGESEYVFTFPEIYYSDDFSRGVKRIAAGGDYTLPVFYYLNGAEKTAARICAECSRGAVEPYAEFHAEGEPFTYFEGCDGIMADGRALLADISGALNGGDFTAHVGFLPVKRALTLKDIYARTAKLASFTTFFDSSNGGRAFNIKLAAEKLNGTVVLPGEELSFNAAVGERTAENGFMSAKIIEGGKFVEGIGGGVCQVSTTLYNAAALSGLKITEYHPHSLAVSYVPPSRDAMVSGSYCDLRIQNTRKTPIYVRANCSGGAVSCAFYGESDGYDYSFASEVTGYIKMPSDVCVEGEEDGVITPGREGIISEGRLVREKDGVRETAFSRKDRYSPVARVRSVKKEGGMPPEGSGNFKPEEDGNLPPEGAGDLTPGGGA